MAIRFDCPSCKANYEVADDLGGKMIMCRVCKKRGAVRHAAPGGEAAGAATTTATMQKSLTITSTSRRNFLKVGLPIGVASVVAIAGGALLARRPWARYFDPPETDRRRRGPGGPPPDGKGGPAPDGKEAPPADKGGGQPKGPV